MDIYFKILLICAFWAAAESFGCLKDAQESANNLGMMGGWQLQKLESSTGENARVKNAMTQYIKIALERDNKPSNDIHTFDLVDDRDMRVYQQVVNGINYCIKFEAQSTGCKNASPNCSPATKTCALKVYEPFNTGIMVLGEPVNGGNVQELKCIH